MQPATDLGDKSKQRPMLFQEATTFQIRVVVRKRVPLEHFPIILIEKLALTFCFVALLIRKVVPTLSESALGSHTRGQYRRRINENDAPKEF